MKIKFNDLSSQWKIISANTIPNILRIMEEGSFILGKDVEIFETTFKSWNGNDYAIGVGNGTDALIISVSSLNLQGKTIFYVPANTYIATLLGVVLSTHENYEYKLIDCDEFFQMDMNLLEIELDKNSNLFDNIVVMPVHLYGISCNMKKLIELKNKYNFFIIEDCSQSHGTITEENKKVGTYGDISVFSLYPGKNLGASGDAGIIVTDNIELYNRCLYLRNLGSIEKYKHDIVGRNSRLDTLQSVVLQSKLEFIDDWNHKRNCVANFYKENIKNKLIKLINTPYYCKYNTYHIFPIITNYREEFIKFLSKNNVPSLIHYPIPIERTLAFYDENAKNTKTLEFSEKLVSLPIHPFLTDDELHYICSIINQFNTY